MDKPKNIVAEKTANALLQDAESDGLNRRAILVISAFKAFLKGLWVGGTVYLTNDSIQFHPNALNNAVHKGELGRTYPLGDVVSVIDRFGVATRIVDVRFSDGRQFTFRCYGAKQFAQKIIDQRATVRSVVEK